MKILYAGYVQGIDNAHRYYFFPQRLINGFTRLGHTVHIFNDRDTARYLNFWRSSTLGQKAMNRSFIQACEDYAPDLIVLGHCEKITNETLQQVYARNPDLKIIVTNVDPITDAKTDAALLIRSDAVDAIFSTTAGPALKKYAGQRAKIGFWPNLVDDSIDTGRAFDEDDTIDLFFAGSSLGENDRRHTFLLELIDKLPQDVDFKLLGSGFNAEKIMGHEYISTLSRVSKGLIINKTEDQYLYASDRMSHYIANGVLCFCHEGPRYTDIFDESEIVVYNDADELTEKINKHHHDKAMTTNKARKAHEKIHRIFACEIVSQYLIDTAFEKPHTHTYQWPTTLY